MTDQLPQFTQSDWVLRDPEEGRYYIDGDDITCEVRGCTLEEARLMSRSPKLYRALVALAKVAKVESDAEYRAVLDARDVIAEVLGS